MSIGNLESLCRELSRECIGNAIPAEAPFFDLVWDVLREHMFPDGEALSPEHWHIGSSQGEIISGLGLHGGEDLQAISIVSTLSALMFVMVSSGSHSKKRLDELTAKYAAEFGTPNWAVSHIKSLVTRHMKDLPAIVSPKKAFKKPYLIWESGKSLRDGTEKNLEEFREAAKQRKFYIFANDAKRAELLVCGQLSKLKVGETFSWATLMALLERIGSRWTYEELAVRIYPDKEYVKGKHRSHIYQIVRHIKEVLAADIDESDWGIAPDSVDCWFDTKQQNRVEVSSDLQACLIRKNPATESPLE